jgi:O-acetylhomoserine/O-acetylserine sulfhydrylase-like pyridoxal-dependent enzyme
MQFKTLAVHSGHRNGEHQGAVMTPIYQTSTFAFRLIFYTMFSEVVDCQ